MDGNGSNGGAPTTSQSERLLGEGKTTTGGQEARGPNVGFNLASKSVARQGVFIASTQPNQGYTAAPSPTRPSELSRGSPFTTLTWSTMSRFLMGLDNV